MYTTPQHCIDIVHIINNRPYFSCLTFPNFPLNTMLHYLLVILFLLLSIVFLFILFLIVRWFIVLNKQLSEPKVLLEITPPFDTKQTPFSTDQFITSLHSLGKSRTLIDIFLGRKSIISLELFSSKENGIRFCLRVPKNHESSVRKNVAALLPGADIHAIDEYLPRRNNLHWDIKEITLSEDFIYPLQEQQSLSQYDPIAYFTSHMTQLKPDEMVLMQINLTPVLKSTHPFQIKQIENVKKWIRQGKDAATLFRRNNSFVKKIISNIFLSLAFIALSPLSVINFFFGGNKQGDFLPFWLFREDLNKIKEPLSEEKKNIQKIILTKITKDLFEVSIRVYITHQDKETLEQRMEGFLSPFQALHTDLQGLTMHNTWYPFNKILFFKLKHRLLSHHAFLSSSEIANMYHFPYTPITHTEDLVQSKTQELPVPLSIKNEQKDLSIVFAHNSYASQTIRIGQNLKQRRRHTYIIGGTGMGKTTLLYFMIMQDILAGNGVCVIDPHGDLIQKILQSIPKERWEDIVLVDPDDSENPIGLNLLELPVGLTKTELKKYKDKLTGTVIEIFMKLFPPKGNAYRMENILRHALLTVLETEDPTLFTIQKLLTDYKYRKNIVDTLTSPILVNFWKKEFASMGSMQRSDAISPITTRLGEFFTSTIAQNILLQKKSTINFKEIMDNKKILLCDLSKGKITKSVSSFFGSLITAQIELTAMQRVRIPEEERVDFYLYIDEFQNFATPSFAEMMGESRKYRVDTILAHQGIAQIEDKNFIDIVLTNTGTVISFHTGSPLDEKYILPFFTPEVNVGQLNALPPYHFYIKITDTTPSVAFTGQTEILDISASAETAEKVRELSRTKYTRKVEDVEKEIEEMFAEEVQEKNNQIKTKEELDKEKEALLKKANENEKK